MLRGRKPVPTHLKLLRGNPGKRRINRVEPAISDPLGVHPDSIQTDAQKALWARVCAEAPQGLFRSLDRELLAVWVAAADLHRQALAEINKRGLMLKSPHKGILMQNPWLAILNRQAMIMMKAASEMGFTPSSRSRIQMPSGSVDPDNPFQEFA
jgi:P27 family predicted phage terminase small subunit